MSKVDLTPMLVQYLVGLCCLRSDPDAIDVTVGNMVFDAAAGKERDVDVTVTTSERDGTKRAFKAYEVKREGAALDVAHVEALCMKLLDMPSITHRAIVSCSGFTAGAQAKAANHGIELFALTRWTRPLEEQFPMLTMSGTADERFPMTQLLLCWLDFSCAVVARSAPGAFRIDAEDVLLDATGRAHPKYGTFARYQQELLLRSTEILAPIDPACAIRRTFPVPVCGPDAAISAGPPWPHTHTLDLSADDVHLRIGDKICRLDVITITGFLAWERHADRAQYYVIERVPGGDALGAALIATEPREGHMTCLVFSKSTRNVDVHFVRLAEKHLNAIRRLTIALPGPANVDGRDTDREPGT